MTTSKHGVMALFCLPASRLAVLYIIFLALGHVLARTPVYSPVLSTLLPSPALPSSFSYFLFVPMSGCAHACLPAIEPAADTTVYTPYPLYSTYLLFPSAANLYNIIMLTYFLYDPIPFRLQAPEIQSSLLFPPSRHFFCLLNFLIQNTCNWHTGGHTPLCYHGKRTFEQFTLYR